MQKNKNKIRNIVNAVCALAIICVFCTGAVYDAAGFDVSINEIDEFNNIDNTINVRTRNSSVEEILKTTNIETDVFDKLNATGDISENDVLVLRRGVGITIECDGEVMTTSSTHKNVGEALTENGIFLEENDYTIPSADNTLKNGDKISVIRVLHDTQVSEETIPYETIYKYDNSLYEGEKKTIQNGVNGIIKITNSIVCENGTEISRSETERVTAVEKQDEIILCGTKKKEVKPQPKQGSPTSTPTPKSKKSTQTKSSSDNNMNYKKVISMTATAYSAFKKDGSYGKTASGRTAGHGIVAVDPKVIPLGTKVYVEGYGYAVAADTGGVIKGNKIDLCFEKSNKEIMAYGRRTVKVYILE